MGSTSSRSRWASRRGAAVILDRKVIAEFQTAFDAVEEWCKRPNRRLADLPGLIGQSAGTR